MSEEKTLSANAQKIVDLVEGLSILELADLVKAMEEKYGISAAAAVVAVAGGAAADAGADDEKTTVNVVMTSAGQAKIAVIKVVRDLTGLGLKEAKDLVDAGGVIKENLDRPAAEDMKKKLEEAGATVEFK